MVRVGEAEDYIVHVIAAHSVVTRRECEPFTEGQHFTETCGHLVGSDRDLMRPFAGKPGAGDPTASRYHSLIQAVSRRKALTKVKI